MILWWATKKKKKKINEIRSGKLKKGKKQAYDDNGFSSDSAKIYTESIKEKKS